MKVWGREKVSKIKNLLKKRISLTFSDKGVYLIYEIKIGKLRDHFRWFSIQLRSEDMNQWIRALEIQAEGLEFNYPAPI